MGQAQYQTSGFLEKLEAGVCERSCVVFLWVYLIIPVVLKQLNQAPTKLSKVLNELDILLPELSRIYADILSNVIDPENRFDAYLLLRWAVGTPRTLHLLRLTSESGSRIPTPSTSRTLR